MENNKSIKNFKVEVLSERNESQIKKYYFDDESGARLFCEALEADTDLCVLSLFKRVRRNDGDGYKYIELNI